MDVHIDDDGFVRAPAARCYRVLTDLERWPVFWPSTRVEVRGGDRATVLAGRRPRRLRLDVRAGRWRHDLGFVMASRGDLDGTWEVWLEEAAGGTVVHHLVTGTMASRRAATSLRRWLRRGLWGLKDVLQTEALAGGAAPDAPVPAP